MDKANATGVAGVLIGAGVAVAALTLPWEIPLFLRHVLFWSGVVSAVGGALWLVHIHYLYNRRRVIYRGAPSTVIILLLILIGFVELPKDCHIHKGLPLGNNFYVTFSFPHPTGITGDTVEIELRFLNNEENLISVENISVMELFGSDKQPYSKLDECYDPNIVEAKITNDEIASDDTPTQGASSTKILEFVSYKRPVSVTLNGADTKFPLNMLPKTPTIVTVAFPVNANEKKRSGFNFFVVCPAIKFFDAMGQESIAICPGLIDMSFSKEDYSADSYRVARMIPRRDHIMTMGPSPESGNIYRVLAKRTGRFQLTPKMGANTCPLVAID